MAREVKYFHNGAARFEIRRHYDDGYGWAVWDRKTDTMAFRLNGEPALYRDRGGSDDGSYKYASERCENLNHYGPEAPTGKWVPGGRGRPPKDSNYRSPSRPIKDVSPSDHYGYYAPRELSAATTAPIRTIDTTYHDIVAKAERASQKSTIDSMIEKVEAEVGIDREEKIADTIDLDEIKKHVTVEIERRAEGAEDEIKARLAQIQNAITDKIDREATDLLQMLEDTKEEIKRHKKIEIKSERGIKVLGGQQHMRFVPLLRAVNAGVLPLMVGPAGTGKTTAGEQLADALDLPFYAISVGAQTTKSDFLGFIDASGVYRDTMFRRAYEGGGIFLVDEMDAGNANVLIVLNAALAGKMCAFPDKMVTRHKDFIAIAAANTYGMGANRVYVGRNQLDAATLDRFVPFDWPVDEVLEASFVASMEHGPRWHIVVKTVRKHADSQAWHVICSPRATIKGAALLDAGFGVEEVVEMTLTNGADASQKQQIKSMALVAWGANGSI